MVRTKHEIFHQTTGFIVADRLLEGHQRIRSLPDARDARIEFLKSWTKANPDIGRKEVAFLDRDDLMTLAEVPDEAMATLEPLVEKFSFLLRRLIRKVALSMRQISIALLMATRRVQAKQWPQCLEAVSQDLLG